MEACQGVSKIICDAAKISHSAESKLVKLDDDVAINNSDKRSIDPVNCQRNILWTAESSVVTDQNVAGQGRGSKRKLGDLENQAIAVELDLEVGSQQDRSRIRSRIKDTPTTFTSDERTIKSRLRNSRMPTEGKPFWKRHVSTPKYASFLRMFRKEETDNKLRGNSLSRKNKEEKSQHRKELSAERYNLNLYNKI